MAKTGGRRDFARNDHFPRIFPVCLVKQQRSLAGKLGNQLLLFTFSIGSQFQQFRHHPLLCSPEVLRPIALMSLSFLSKSP